MPPDPDPAGLRVLQLIPSLETGGLERVAAALTLELRDLVEHVVVATSGGEPLEAMLREDGVNLRKVARPYPRPLPLVRAAAGLVPLLRRERPHVVHAHNPGAGVAAALARLLSGRRDLAIVTTYHGVMPGRMSRASAAMERSSDVVVAIAPAATRVLVEHGLDPAKSATVLNAVEPVPKRGRDAIRAEFGVADAELVVTVGRYAEEKNHALLVEALALLAGRRPRLRALLVGVGELEEELKAQVRRLGLDDVVAITGERADAIDITAAADVFALSSDWEGLPLAVLEALALGTPVVSTDVGGISDAVRDGETGLLVPPRDPEALAAALERVLADRELAERLAAGGLAFAAAELAERAMAERYVEIYSSAVSARRKRRRSGASPS